MQRLVLLFAALIVPAAAGAATVPPPPELAAKSWVLMDAASGSVLVDQQGSQRLPPASLTKLMTSHVAALEMQRGRLKENDLVNISEKAWRMGGSKMFVKVGNQVSVHDLMRGIIVQSGNDASIALAEHIAGGEDTFASMMNQEAKRLGLSNTHFVNATGWPDPNHYSSALDMARLARAIILEDPAHYAMYAEKEFVWNGIKQPNRNLLLWRDPTVDGLKTGHTEEAGYCLVASGKRDGQRLIAVVFGTESEAGPRQRDRQAAWLRLQLLRQQDLLQEGRNRAGRRHLERRRAHRQGRRRRRLRCRTTQACERRVSDPHRAG